MNPMARVITDRTIEKKSMLSKRYQLQFNAKYLPPHTSIMLDNQIVALVRFNTMLLGISNKI